MSGREFWKGETWAIIKAMRAKGNQPGLIADWKESVRLWAENNPRDPNAVAALAWLPLWQVRAAYLVDELAPIWPALAIVVGHTTIWRTVPKSAKRLEFELDYAGLPFRLLESRKYYIVERIHYWSKVSEDKFYQEILGE